MTFVSRDLRVEVTSSFARTTWLIEERDRLDARRWETRVSSGVEIVEGEGGGRLSVEDAIYDEREVRIEVRSLTVLFLWLRV